MYELRLHRRRKLRVNRPRGRFFAVGANVSAFIVFHFDRIINICTIKCNFFKNGLK